MVYQPIGNDNWTIFFYYDNVTIDLLNLPNIYLWDNYNLTVTGCCMFVYMNMDGIYEMYDRK